MGKKQQLRKQAKIEQERIEKEAIEQRRAEKSAPFVKTAKRIVAASVATIILLYIGVAVSARLPQILDRLAQEIRR
jgi:hypothetical protein